MPEMDPQGNDPRRGASRRSAWSAGGDPEGSVAHRLPILRCVGVHGSTTRLRTHDGAGMGIEPRVEGEPGVDTPSAIESRRLGLDGPCVRRCRLGVDTRWQREDGYGRREEADAQAADRGGGQDHAGA